MLTIKAHFDGNTIVLDEPFTLEVGQVVQVVVGSSELSPSPTLARRSLVGFAKGMFEMRDDFNDPLAEFADYQ